MDKTFLVVGTGISGVAAVKLLLERDCSVIVYDSNANLDACGLVLQHPELEGVPIYIGMLPEDVWAAFDIAILSPGVPVDSPMVVRMKREGKTVWGEIELAYRIGKGTVIAITGTNGKTTTTSLTGSLLKEHYADVKVVGNIGIPYTGVAGDTTDDSIIVAEISSFQLETIDTFAPKISAILNITPDHLNRHHTMENYIAIKESITKNQGSDDICILNYEDENLRRFAARKIGPRVIWFSSRRELEEGLYYREADKTIYRAAAGKREAVIHVDELQIVGRHNYENAMAAIAIAECMGVSLDEIRSGLKAFKAVEHRIEYVCTKRGVRYYNDSKGTNPDAAIKAIEAMDRPTVLIGGGYDKQSSYDEWVEAFKGKVKVLVLIGATSQKIARCCREHGFEHYIFADTLEQAVSISADNAEPGDAVLLSPACASWDMFRSYEERGRLFKQYVRKLPD